MKNSFKKEKITENEITVSESNSDVYKNNKTAVGNENTSPGCNNSIFGEERVSSQGNIFFEWKPIPNSAPFSTFTQFSLLSDLSHNFPSVFSATNDPMSKSLSMLPYVHESTPRPLKIVEPRQQQIHFGIKSIDKSLNTSQRSINDAIDEKTEDENIMCKVCYDNKVCVFFYPCGHTQTCKKCSKQLAKSKSRCLFCKKEIKSMHRAFL